MSSTYEKSSMSETDIGDLIRVAKQQEMERSEKAAEKRKNASKSVPNAPKIIESAKDIASAEHGSYVQTKDGMGAIVVDHEVELRKRQENDKTGKALMNLLRPDGLISNANEYVPNYGKDAPEGYNPGVQFINENPYDPNTKKIVEIKNGFSKLVPGLPGHGLVDANSEEGRMVAEAFHKLETGEIVLPTPEEYEQQKEEIKRKREEANAKRQAEAQDALNQKIHKDVPVKNIPLDEPQMAEMPEDAIMTSGTDDLLKSLGF